VTFVTELPVHVSRDELHAVEVPESFEASGSFDIRITNHGQSVHVHLHLDDRLSQLASIDAGNHYVESESERYVRVNADTEGIGDKTLRGKLKVVTAYGATTRWVDVELSEPEDDPEPVQVDASLSTPPQETSESEPLIDRPEIPVLVLGGVALLIAAVAAFVVQSTPILLGSLVVLGGVLAALFLLLR